MVAMGHLAQELGLPTALRQWVTLKQKQIRYDPLGKLLTFFISLVEGCGYTSDIDTKLKPYRAMAQAWGLAEFPGQNAVNATLHALKWEHVRQLNDLFQDLYERAGLARQHPRDQLTVVDIDAMGLPVSPRSRRFQWAERGYFPKGRNQKGLQFVAAFVGEDFREVLGGHLAPGYAHLTHGMPDILALIEQRLGIPPRRGDLLWGHAGLLQAEMKALAQKVEHREQAIQEAHIHLHQLKTRMTRRAAKIQGLRALGRRLPKRAAKLQPRIKEEQRKQRADRKREQKTQRGLLHVERKRQSGRQELDLLKEARERLLALAAEPIELGRVRLIVLRADSSLGTGDSVTDMFARGYLFVVRGRDARTARRLAAQVDPATWQRVDPRLRAAEVACTRITECPFEVRLVACERTTERHELRYSFLVTNLPYQTYDTVALVAFYNRRQTIEAFNRVIGHVLSLKHLRTGSITANEGVAMLAMLAHDFLSWAAHRFFAGTPYEGIAIREFVEKGLHVVARVTWLESNTCRIELSADSPYARAFVAGPQANASQMPLRLPNFGPSEDR